MTADVRDEALDGDAHVLRVAGELDAAGFAMLEPAVQHALARDAGRLVVDLTGTTFMSSVALAALVRASRRLREEGRLLVVVAPDTGQPAAKFDLSGTRHFFHLCASVDEARSILNVRDEPPRGDGAATARLQLYVNGASQFARRAVAAAGELRAHLPPGSLIDVVDVHERPDVAERERILATPLLVRLRPEPVRRIVGDLHDLDEVVRALRLPTRSAP